MKYKINVDQILAQKPTPAIWRLNIKYSEYIMHKQELDKFRKEHQLETYETVADRELVFRVLIDEKRFEELCPKVNEILGIKTLNDMDD